MCFCIIGYYFYFMCMGVMCTTCMPSACGLVEGIRTPGTEVTGSCEPPYGCGKQNPDPVEEQSVLLTAEESLQPTDKYKLISL